MAPSPLLPRLAAAHPDLAARHDAYVRGVWQHPALPPGLLELCRLRIAQLLGLAAPGRIAPLPADREALVPHLASWTATAGPVDRACLAFAEQFVLDAQALDEATVDGVRAAVGPEGLAVLAVGVGLAEGLVRAALVLGPEGDPGRG
jgi:hypothetical protein